MRVPLKELLDNLGVGYVLSAYETCPWSAYDEEKAITCSAEVRMNHDGDEIEAELQFVHDTPPADGNIVEQVFWLYAKPATSDKWDIFAVKIKGEDHVNKSYAWERKSCDFFNTCVQEIKMGNIPDIDEIYDQTMESNERYGGGARGGGSKSPKIKPQSLLGMKNGRGI